MNRIKMIFSPDYFLAVPKVSTFEIYYLYLSLFIIVSVIFCKFFFVVKKRSSVYKKFDKRWFWGYLDLGMLGVFLWFSRNQELPIFGTRLASYLWLLVLFLYLGYLLYYFKKKAKPAIIKYQEKKRKEKYLKR